MPTPRISALGLVALLAGCASSKVTDHAIVESKARVRAAKAMEADSYPRARLYLQLAREHVAAAEKLIAENKLEAALALLEQAAADAELALAAAQEARARAEAEEARRHAAQLKRQL